MAGTNTYYARILMNRLCLQLRIMQRYGYSQREARAPIHRNRCAPWLFQQGQLVYSTHRTERLEKYSATLARVPQAIINPIRGIIDGGATIESLMQGWASFQKPVFQSILRRRGALDGTAENYRHAVRPKIIFEKDRNR